MVHVERVGASVRILRIGRPAGFGFEAGQYLKLGVAGSPRRSLSLASAPDDPDLELCVELVPGGRVTPTLFGLGVGDRVELSDAATGSLRLARSARTHLLVGTVTGIAPLRSLLRAALANGSTDEFVVLHGASSADELPYAAELAELARSDGRVQYLPTVSRPGEVRNRRWQGETGRVEALAERIARGLDPRTTGVCATGNSSMVANVRTLLGGRGFRVATESFH